MDELDPNGSKEPFPADEAVLEKWQQAMKGRVHNDDEILLLLQKFNALSALAIVICHRIY